MQLNLNGSHGATLHAVWLIRAEILDQKTSRELMTTHGHLVPLQHRVCDGLACPADECWHRQQEMLSLQAVHLWKPKTGKLYTCHILRVAGNNW